MSTFILDQAFARLLRKGQQVGGASGEQALERVFAQMVEDRSLTSYIDVGESHFLVVRLDRGLVEQPEQPVKNPDQSTK